VKRGYRGSHDYEKAVTSLARKFGQIAPSEPAIRIETPGQDREAENSVSCPIRVPGAMLAKRGERQRSETASMLGRLPRFFPFDQFLLGHDDFQFFGSLLHIAPWNALEPLEKLTTSAGIHPTDEPNPAFDLAPGVVV